MKPVPVQKSYLKIRDLEKRILELEMIVERAEQEKSHLLSVYKHTLKINLQLYHLVAGKPFMMEDTKVH